MKTKTWSVEVEYAGTGTCIVEAKTREEAEKKALAYEFESEHMEAVHFEEVLLDTLEEEEE